MPQITKRGTINSRISTVGSGSIPSDLYIRDVPDFLDRARRYDTPMLNMLKKGKGHDRLKWEFGEGDLAPDYDTINEGGTLSNSDTTLTVANGGRWQANYQMRIDDENLLVTAVSSNNLTVIRAWGGTVAATHADGSKIRILGPATAEGAVSPDSPISFGEVFYTGPQIMEEIFTYTHRARVVPDYEVKSDRFKREQTRKMDEMKNFLDSVCLSGAYNAGDGTSDGSNPSTTRGLRQATTTNVTDMNGDPLTLDALLTAAQTMVSDVGQKDAGKTVMGNYFVKQIWNSWYQGSRRATLKDDKAKIIWDEVETDFGIYRFVINVKCDNNEIFIWNPDDASLDWMDDSQWETGMYTTQGWFDRGFVRGDYGPLFQADRRRLRIKNFSATKADYPLINIAA